MKYVFVLVFLSLVFGLYIFGQKSEIDIKLIRIAGKELKVEVVDSDLERMKGLSGKEGLSEGSGMLFVFDQEGFYGIWMKDMKFPIDIAWLNKNKEIIHIEKNVSPDTYPKVFYATRDGAQLQSLYVLETNANFFENSRIKIGDRAEF